jgi:hypothetical protein
MKRPSRSNQREETNKTATCVMLRRSVLTNALLTTLLLVCRQALPYRITEGRHPPAAGGKRKWGFQGSDPGVQVRFVPESFDGNCLTS